MRSGAWSPSKVRVLHALLVSLLMSAALPAGALESRYFTSSDGVRLHYLQGGQGQTLVFVPGWSMPADIFAPQLERFARTHRVIAFDPRSQGRSAIAPSGHNPERRGLPRSTDEDRATRAA